MRGLLAFCEERFRALSLHNKFFLSILAVIMLISLAIALLARWILVSSLTDELELRGVAIAQSIADKASGYILDNDMPNLTSIAFDTALIGERKHLVSYIFITDAQDAVLAHTFTRPFPAPLMRANPLKAGQASSIKLVTLLPEPAHDIAVPINEGIYKIGTVHVGLNKKHIDNLIDKLRNTFLGFISAVFVIIFLISHRLSRNITRPISRLTRISDDVSRGNFDVKLGAAGSDDWHPELCPAYNDTDLPCWHFDQGLGLSRGFSQETLRTCSNCVFYKKRPGDEVVQLADSFNNMVWSIKLYRKQLRESEEKYRHLFDAGPDPIFVVDAENHAILDANSRCGEVYGYGRDELIGRLFTDIHPGFAEELLQRFDGAEEPNCAFCSKIIHYKRGGKPFFVNVHACPMGYRGHRAFILAATDITEMIEKDAQLIQANKMKTLGEMSAGIAHELNQPLNVIKMGSDYLGMMAHEELAVPKEQLGQVVDEISVQVDRAAEIIDTLRGFGHKGDFCREKLDVNRSVKSVLRLVGKQLALQNIDVRLELAEDLDPIMAQDNRVQQVLFNLLANARDAIKQRAEEDRGPHERTILIRTGNDSGRVAVAVADSGAGIAESCKDKIFEPFFTTKQTGQGMGLGLSITYGIVKDFEGEIEVDSIPGRGTTFRLFFPAVPRA